MLLADFYLPVAAFACLAFFVWLVVVAFMRSPKWGWLVLLLSPFSAIAFAYRHWRHAAFPFVGYLLSLCATLGLAGHLFAQAGGMEAIATLRRIESGELSEDEARQSMARVLEKMQAAGLVSESQLREFENLRSLLRDMGREREAAPPPVTEGEAAESPAFAIQPKQKVTVAALAAPRRVYRDVPLEEAHLYVGQEVKIVTENEVERLAVLAGVAGDVLRFEQQVGKGEMAFEMRGYEIRSLKILQ